ncbi:MAG: nitrous oxide reductase accessory protein NosL [Chitinophagaceae bacterium]|nr:nitrous oxide reductase accessory protein NosL [Chitinophagaceae bacterium]
MKATITPLTRIISIVTALSLIGVIFLPLWSIELTAPQYPEGLELKIYASKLGGSVDIVNGLNHYIGMRTLHEKDFPEFAVRWEYNYGHNLDPTAPIQVPGMSYQPPLIGFKQLLNFGVYSIPDTGGWIFIAVAVLMLAAVFMEWKKWRASLKMNTAIKIIAALAFTLTLNSCSTAPQPFKLGVDACDYCKMTITDNRFGGEIITEKGKLYKFDDAHCMLSFEKERKSSEKTKDTYLVDYSGNGNLIILTNASLIKSELLKSPMGANIAAFSNLDSMEKIKKQLNAEAINWDQVSNK